MSFWYLASDRELLLDLDDYMRPAPSKTGESRGPWGEIFFRRRLGDAIRAGRLDVMDPPVYLDRSNSARHWHAIVRLRKPMPLNRRLIWQLRLGSDLMRSQADLMRADMGVKFPSLLIRNTPMKDFYRPPDRQCPCTRKHDTSEQMQLNGRGCPIWRELRGMTPWELFGPCHKGNHRGVTLPIGEVPLDLILRIDEERKEPMGNPNFSDVMETIASVSKHCFECDSAIRPGENMVVAYWEIGTMQVTFHKSCWEGKVNEAV